MIYLKTDEPQFYNELCDEIRLFIEATRIEKAETAMADGTTVCHCFFEEAGSWHDRCTVADNGVEKNAYTYSYPVVLGDELEVKKMRIRGAKLAVFFCLRAYTGLRKPWGALTGIRPTKLYRQTAARQGREAAEKLFLKEFCVDEKKLGLTRKICAVQQPFIDSVDEDVDVYIGIPFCVTKCSYCSFSSGLVTGDGRLERGYVDALEREIAETRHLLAGKAPRCVYVGGGTPTALRPDQLERVTRAAASFGGRELTVEAGRPDTIDREKLSILKENGVSRISINAQTTSDAALEKIGRQHTREDFIRAFEMARSFGFDVINTDVIIGLPDESPEDFSATLHDVIALDPANITVHTLAIKRASKFGMENAKGFMSSVDAEQTVEAAELDLMGHGYRPYYMYRQKYMTGNLENVGFALPGTECVYNIDIMEETASILAYGAGGMSKRLFGERNRIERSPNVKNIEQYISRTEEMAARKLRLFGGSGDC